MPFSVGALGRARCGYQTAITTTDDHWIAESTDGSTIT